MSNAEIFIAKESAMVPYPDEDGNEVPTLITKGKTKATKNSKMYSRFGEFFEPLKADYDDEDGDTRGTGRVSQAAKSVAKKATAPRAAKKAAAKKAAAAKQGTSAGAVSNKDVKGKDVPTPPAGHVPNPDPAGEGGPDEGVTKGTEAPALTDNPDNA